MTHPKQPTGPTVLTAAMSRKVADAIEAVGYSHQYIDVTNDELNALRAIASGEVVCVPTDSAGARYSHERRDDEAARHFPYAIMRDGGIVCRTGAQDEAVRIVAALNAATPAGVTELLRALEQARKAGYALDAALSATRPDKEAL